MRDWLVRGLGCCMIGAGLLGMLCQHPTATEYVTQGYAQMHQLEWHRALGSLRQATQIDATDAQAWAGMAQIWHWQQYNDQAATAINTALQLAPKSAAYWQLAGDIAADLHGAATITDWEHAIALSPASAAAQGAGVALADYWLRQAQPDRVLSHCVPAVAPTASLLRLCAIAALHLGRTAQAVAWCHRSGDNCAAFADRAHNWQGTPADFANLGYTELAAGYAQLAVAAFDIALAARPDVGPWFAYRGWSLWQMGERDHAAQDFVLAAQLAPDDPGAIGGMALLDQYAGKSKEALILLQGWQQYHPASAAIWQLRAIIAGEGRDFSAEADALWNETFVAPRSDQPAAAIALAQFYQDTGLGRDDGRAAWAVNMACQLAPSSAVAHDLAAMLALEQGNPVHALDELRHAITLDPHDALAHAHLGLLAYRLGARAQARIELERAADLATDTATRQLVQPTLLALGGATQ